MNPAVVAAELNMWIESKCLSQRARKVFRDYFSTLNLVIAHERDDFCPPYLQPVLQRLASKCDLKVQDDERGPPSIAAREIDVEIDLQRGIYLPGLNMERNFHDYAQKTRSWNGCRKDGGGKPKDLLPGTFTLTCVHGIILGFHLMTQPESPETLFSIFYSRFPDADRVVIYDNACNYHEYCMNREPQFFANQVTKQDRIHAKGHVGCTIGHNLDEFWWAKAVNSQVAEQGNALLDGVKKQSTFMTIGHYALFVRFVMANMNRRKITKFISRASTSALEEFREVAQAITKINSEVFGRSSTRRCTCAFCNREV
ncbi:hypothetical protein AaE_013113 [Aphanomyces astaci]|uniref:Uncharacterized protein n=1 Tax=Aphanomyces astaci TaxID=112090 RepID=A0A6A4Z8Q3_APHAT|nr:hypothetical protein AaE_013113 [Aphanomyces astaci]